MLFLLIILVLASLISYKKTVLFTAATLMFMGNLSSGIEGVKLFYAAVLVQIILFYLLGYNRKSKDPYPLLILIPTVITGFCYLVSSYVGTIHNYAKNVVNICAWFYFPYIIWHIISSKRDVKTYGIYLFSFFVIVGIYAFVELLLGENIFALWAEKTGIITGDLGGIDSVERFGLLRCNSFLPYCSALGMVSSFIFLIMIILLSKNHKCLPYQKLLIYMMPLCVLFSGTRSQFLVFILCFTGLFLSKESRNSKSMRVIIILGTLCLVVFSAIFIDIFDSIVHSDTSSTGGSNTEMRLRQYAIAESYWEESPWFGHGRNYTWEYAIPETPALLGAESIIFTQLIDHGLVGLVCFYAIGICLAIWSFRYSKPLVALPIAFIVGKTISTVVGVEYNIPIILCIFVVKALSLYKRPCYGTQCQ